MRLSLRPAGAAVTGLLLVAACATASRPGVARPAASAAGPGPGPAAASPSRASNPAGASPAGPGAAIPGTGTPDPSAPAGLDGCFRPARGAISKVRGTGETLTLAVLGSGPRVIVMSNESDENLCSWLPVATRLAAAGYRVVLWDYGGNLPPDELASVVGHLRAASQVRVVLMGASEGAKASLIAAARITPLVRGVVSLSAESVLAPGLVVADSVRHLSCPLLLVTARQDPYGSAQAAPDLLRAARSPDKRLLTVPGSDHGTALLAGAAGAVTLPAITAFLRRLLSPRREPGRP